MFAHACHARWMFLLGSIIFATKFPLRFAREIRLNAEGRDEDLAKRFGE